MKSVQRFDYHGGLKGAESGDEHTADRRSYEVLRPEPLIQESK